VDPKVSQTDQPYVFAGDSPLNATDPLGLFRAGIGGQLCGGGAHPTCNTGNTPGPTTVRQSSCGSSCGNFGSAVQPSGEGGILGLASDVAKATAPLVIAPAARHDLLSGYSSANNALLEGWNFVNSEANRLPGATWWNERVTNQCVIQGVSVAAATLVTGGGDAVFLFGAGALSPTASTVIAGSIGFGAGCLTPPSPEEW
jgi:hypothetical protein